MVGIEHDIVGVGSWVVRPQLNELERRGRTCSITTKSMDVLLYLATHAGVVVPMAELLDQCWSGLVVGDAVVHKIICNLRSALDDDAAHPTYIRTVRRRGYVLIAPITMTNGRSTKFPVKIRWKYIRDWFL